MKRLQPELFETFSGMPLFGAAAKAADEAGPAPAQVAPAAPVAKAKGPAAVKCAHCHKRPARVLTAGRKAVYCSEKCRDAVSASMAAWSAKLARTKLAGADDSNPELFKE